MFLTPPQKAYISHYITTLNEGLGDVAPGEAIKIVIDMDEIANAVPGEPRPDFYYPSTAQQTQFNCKTCNSFNDVRGRYAYCASCGWRNNIASLKVAFARIRERLTEAELAPAEAVKQAVSEFDSTARDFIDQLKARTPMKKSRRDQLQDLLFHSIDRPDEIMKKAFDINMLQGMESDREFIKRMFLRRHVYEHNGGVATARYVCESGDDDIEKGTMIREKVENAHKLISCLNRMAKNIEVDFHEILPPDPYCIKLERDRKARFENEGQN